MTRHLRISVIAIAVGVWLAQAAQAGWLIHNVDSLFLADKKNQKHPKALTVVLVVPDDARNLPEICSGYSNSMKKKNRGRITIDIELMRVDETLENFKFSGRVRDNRFSDCVFVDHLTAGDVLVFSFRFKSMARLKIDSEGTDVFDAGGAVVSLFGDSNSARPRQMDAGPDWLKASLAQERRP